MNKNELRELSKEELQTILQDDMEELENLRFQKALQQLENPLKIRHLRREIARIKTVLNEITLGIRYSELGERSG